MDVKIESNLELVNPGDTLSLNCIVYGHDSAQIHWQFPYGSNAWRDNVVEDRNKLKIENVTYENGGVYRCVVQTSVGIFNVDYVLVVQGEFVLILFAYFH